jgi:hypothetical protein
LRGANAFSRRPAIAVVPANRARRCPEVISESSPRTRGPIRRVVCFERRCWTTFAQPPTPVVMGPCVSQGRRCVRPDAPPLSRGAFRPGCAKKNFRPSEGVGNAGCPMHPQPRVENKNHTSVVTTSPPERPGIPARNGFNGLLRDLPGDRAFLSPSSSGSRQCPRPVGPASPPLDLTPASRRQDHTTSPSATASLVARACDRSRVSPPCNHSRAKRRRVHRILFQRP